MGDSSAAVALRAAWIVDTLGVLLWLEHRVTDPLLAIGFNPLEEVPVEQRALAATKRTNRQRPSSTLVNRRFLLG